MNRLHLIMTVIIAAQFILFLLGFLFPKEKTKDKKNPFYINIIYVVVCCFLIVEIIAAIPKKDDIKNPLKPLLESSAETELLEFKEYLNKYKDLIITFLE